LVVSTNPCEFDITSSAASVGAIALTVPPVVVTAPINISGAAFAPLLGPSTTPVLLAGTYELQWYSALTFTNARGRAAARVLVDFGGGLLPFSDVIGYRAGGNTGQAIAPSEPLPFTLGGSASITVQIEAQETSAQVANNQRPQFQIVRTS